MMAGDGCLAGDVTHRITLEKDEDCSDHLSDEDEEQESEVLRSREASGD